MRIPSMPVSYGPCLSHVAMHIFKNMATKFSIPRGARLIDQQHQQVRTLNLGTGPLQRELNLGIDCLTKFSRCSPRCDPRMHRWQASARPLGTIIQISPTQAVSATCQGKRVPRSL
eukprot:SAG31_NODE_33188_length_346_cov_22.356275_1_plen_115_part_11